MYAGQISANARILKLSIDSDVLIRGRFSRLLLLAVWVAMQGGKTDVSKLISYSDSIQPQMEALLP